MRYAWGIDPGCQGAVAIISEDRRDIRVVKFSDKDEAALNDVFYKWSMYGPGRGHVENVYAFPGEGVSSAFAFGKATGFVRGLAWGYDLIMHDVQPQVWQRKMALGGTYATKSLRKKAHKEKAILLFPSIDKITLETCDALLIAEYSWRSQFM